MLVSNSESCSWCALISINIAVFASSVAGQATRVVNLPADSLPELVYTNTVFNIAEGGRLPDYFRLRFGVWPSQNIDINVLGGSVGRYLQLTPGSRLDLTSGRVGSDLTASEGNFVTISGGVIGNGLTVDNGSQLWIFGSDFRLDGIPIDGVNHVGDQFAVTELSGNAVLSGTLSDGTPFAFSSFRDQIADGVVTVELAETVPVGEVLMQAEAGIGPQSIRDGQLLVAEQSAVLPDMFQAGRGSTLVMRNGAAAGDYLTAVDATVIADNANIGSLATFLDNSTLRMSQGIIGGGLLLGAESVAHVVGSHVDSMQVVEGAIANVANSTIDAWSTVTQGSSLYATDTSIGNNLTVSDHSKVFLTNGQFAGRLTVTDNSYGELSSVAHAPFDQYVGGVTVEDNSELVVTGDTVIDGIGVVDSHLRLLGGRVESLFLSGGGRSRGSTAVISGGVVDSLYAGRSNSLSLVGGRITANRQMAGRTPGGALSLLVSGDDFRVNGEPVPNSGNDGTRVALTVSSGDYLSGTLADGTPFGFYSESGVLGTNATLTTVSIPDGPSVITASTDVVPMAIRQGQTINVDEGGHLPDGFRAGYGSVVNILPGGSVGSDFLAIGAEVELTGGNDFYFTADWGTRVAVHDGAKNISILASPGSVVSMDGGHASFLRVDSSGSADLTGGRVGYVQFGMGSSVRVSGGAVNMGPGLRAMSFIGGELTIQGGDFNVDGKILDELASIGSIVDFQLDVGSLLTGTLTDGTPFSLNLARGGPSRLILETTQIPAIGPPIITASTDAVPLGIRNGQTLVVDSGSVVATNFRAGRGSHVRIEAGGFIDEDFEAIGASVDMMGGRLAEVQLIAGASMSMSGGVVDSLWVDTASHFTMHGGRARAPLGNTRRRMEMDGGVLTLYATLTSGSDVKIRGGRLAGFVYTDSGASLALEGYNWRLNGELIASGEVGEAVQVDVPIGSSLTGILADGTPLLLPNTKLADGTLTIVKTLPTSDPPVIDASVDPIPLGIHEGQSITVGNGANLPESFLVGWGSHLSVFSGGTVGSELQAVGAEVDIHGGQLGSLEIYEDSQLTMTHGEFSGSVRLFEDTEMVMHGGHIDTLTIGSGSSAVLTGGTIDDLSIFGGSPIVIAGGTTSRFRVTGGSSVELEGTEFFFDGRPIEGLNDEGSLMLETTSGILTGTLLDGSKFESRITSLTPIVTSSDWPRLISTTANLRLTIGVPFLPGDFNHDGTVDTGDYTIWKDDYRSTRSLSADANRDGVVDTADYTIWKDHFGQSQPGFASHTVPEPNSLWLLLIGTSSPIIRCRKYREY
ncbi:MAG: hypothetical protein KDA99_24375 [Planctomycetales bacterium]|nr:hypothetical protein [Planctomycetales bacterium]